MTKLFALPMMIENQKKAHDKHCFGDCGKVSMGGAIEIEEVGPCWVCCEEKCPYEKGVVGPLGTSGITGEGVSIRGLNYE